MINEILNTNNLIINSLGWTLLHSCWQISAIAALLAIFLKFSNTSSNIKYNITQSTLFLIPLICTLTFLHYYQNTAIDIQYNVNGPLSIENLAFNEIAKSTIRDKISLAVNNYSSVIVCLWVTGILLLMIRFTGGLIYTRQLRKTGIISVSKNINEIVNQFKLKSNIKRSIDIFESVLIKVPLTIGYLKPLILLPAVTITGIPPAQLEAIIAHEIAHIKRSDYVYNLVNSLIEIIFFYHPAVWWIMDSLNVERENCCDDIAINLTGDSKILARALAGLNQSFYQPQHTLAMTGKKNHLMERIKRIAGIKENSRKFSYHSYGFVIAAILAATIAFSVKASVQMPDNFLKTSLSMSTNTDYHNLILESIPQDTLKTQKKKPAIKKEQTNSSDPKKEKNELSQAERAKLEHEMKKLQAEMKKLAEDMKVLNEQLGTTNWDSFDFKYYFDMDSVKVDFNDLYRKMNRTDWDKMDFKFYFDKDSLRMNDARKIFENHRLEMEKARGYADVARSKALSDAEKAMRESRKAYAHAMIIQKDIDKRMKNSDEARELIRAKNFRFKADTNTIEEELRKDGLISGEHYTLKIDNKEMVLDGKKQSDEVYKKYVNLIMKDLKDEDGNSMDENKFNIHISK